MSALRHEFFWLDLETTGLDSHASNVGILEWGFALCEDGPLVSEPGAELAIVRQESGVIAYDPATLGAMYDAADPYVQEMHAKNGLWFESAGDEPTRGRRDSRVMADKYLASVARDLGAGRGRGDGKLVLAGASVHFDLDWIRVHLPSFAGFLSHRVLDVSTLKAVDRAWARDPATFTQTAETREHRALADVLGSIDEARLVRLARYGAAEVAT